MYIFGNINPFSISLIFLNYSVILYAISINAFLVQSLIILHFYPFVAKAIEVQYLMNTMLTKSSCMRHFPEARTFLNRNEDVCVNIFSITSKL